MEITTYRVEAAQDEGWWLLTVPELDGIVTQARRLAEAEETARDLIATWLDVDLATVAVELWVPGVSEQVAAAAAARDAMRAAEDEARSRAVAAARAAQAAGLSTRDAAVILHMSHQRVAQLLAS